MKRYTRLFIMAPILLATVISISCFNNNDGGEAIDHTLITSFNFLKEFNPGLGVNLSGIIQLNTITVRAPINTELSSLVATFTTNGVSVTVDGKEQKSGITGNNFFSTVTYRVIDENGGFTDYNVIVKVWHTPTSIESCFNGNAEIPHMAVDKYGTVILVWSHGLGENHRICTCCYIPGNGWGISELFTMPTAGNSINPDIAIDSCGNAITVWDHFNGETTDIWANHFSIFSGWGKPLLIEHNCSSYAAHPRIAMDSSGNAIVVWWQFNETVHNIWANRYTPADGWGTPIQIDNDNSGDSFYPHVGIDGSGNAIAVWYKYDGNLYNVWSSRYTAGGTWSTPELIENQDEGHASYVHVYVNESGKAVAVWQQHDGTAKSIFANIYSPSDGWSTAKIIEHEDTSAILPHAVIDSTDRILVVWQQEYNALTSIWSNTWTPMNGWETPLAIEISETGEALMPRIASYTSGCTSAIWCQSDGLRYNIWASFFDNNIGWSIPELVELNNEGNAMYPEIYIDNYGNAKTVWNQNDGTTNKIMTNIFE